MLLQGPTSAGKTSLIQYLAKKVGQKCVRINNHEHTDLQEYVGMYTADSNGQLVFQEGTYMLGLQLFEFQHAVYVYIYYVCDE